MMNVPRSSWRLGVLAVNVFLLPELVGCGDDGNDAAAERASAGSTTPLIVSVQVETAWGALQGHGVYEGIETDRQDFPFIDGLGLSSYPYLGGFTSPSRFRSTTTKG